LLWATRSRRGAFQQFPATGPSTPPHGRTQAICPLELGVAYARVARRGGGLFRLGIPRKPASPLAPAQ
jgi:hypothetical protein